MTRPKGSKNNKPVVGVTFTESQKETIKEIAAKQGAPVRLVNREYILVKSNDTIDLEDEVIAEFEQGYICQGGVSVTTYSDMDGLHFLYCQAMIRKD